MAACAFSTMCVGRHATARTRSLATQWSSSSSRPRATLRPQSVNIMAVGGFSTAPASSLSSSIDISTPALQSLLLAASSSQQGGAGSNGDTNTRSLAVMSSIFALAMAGSMAVPSCSTSAEPSPRSREPPTPMATSCKLAAAPFSPLSESNNDTTNQTAETTTPTTTRRTVQIRRTVRRRYGSGRGPFAVHDANNLPARFHFYRDTAECEGEIKEEQKKDVLSDSQPYEVSVEAFQGRREGMEDEVEVKGGGRFVAVFDGHGGGEVSMYLKQHLYHLFQLHLEQKHWEESDSDVDDIRLRTPSIPAYMAALRQALHSVETEVSRHSELNFVGSTAVAVVLHENPGGFRTLISANVGDSRAILSRNGKAVELTKDHKPTAEGERKRILQAGGRIFLDDTGVHRVMNLSLSRAIGDGFSKPIVSPEPDIRRFRVEEGGDEFILLASDGLWDVMNSQDAVNFVSARLAEAMVGTELLSKEERAKKMAVARQSMADIIVQEAMRCGSADNTSVVMVWLNEKQE